MSTQSPYLKAIIIFPLVTQIIGSIIAYVAFGMDYCKEGNFDAALFGFFLTFWPLTVPAIINAYFLCTSFSIDQLYQMPLTNAENTIPNLPQ